MTVEYDPFPHEPKREPSFWGDLIFILVCVTIMGLVILTTHGFLRG